MSELERPEPPQDDRMTAQDRALEDFLARRSDMSRAYREAADDAAPSSLDARVLAAAAAPVIRARRLQRWRLPVSLAASFIVVIGVLRLAAQDPSALTPVAPSSSSASAAATVAAVPSVEPQEARQPAPTAADAAPAAIAADAKAVATELARSRDSNTRAKNAADPALASAAHREAEAAAQPDAAAKPSRLQSESPLPVTAAAGAPAAAAPSLPARPRVAEAESVLAPPAAIAKRADAAADLRREPLPEGARDDSWHPGRYQGLALGHATLDDVLRRFGPASVAEAVRSDAPLPDGRTRLRLLAYPAHADARGPLRLYIDANSQALASVALVLKPPLPLAQVERQEGLTPPAQRRSADSPLCAAEPPLQAAEAATFPQYRVYPAQGVYLLLTAPDAVSEISYIDQCR